MKKRTSVGVASLLIIAVGFVALVKMQPKPASATAVSPGTSLPTVEMRIGEEYDCTLDRGSAETTGQKISIASYSLQRQGEDRATIECANAIYLSPTTSCRPDQVKRLAVKDSEEPVTAETSGRRVFLYPPSVSAVKLIFLCAHPDSLSPVEDAPEEEECPSLPDDTVPPPQSV